MFKYSFSGEKYFNIFSAMFSTVSLQMPQKFINGVRKAYAIWWGKLTVYKVEILIFTRSTNKNFIISHLPWLKYFLLAILKSDI